MELKTQARAKSAPRAAAPKEDRKPSRFVQLGEKAKHEAQRKALLDALEKHDWVLSYVAEELELYSAGNVLRAIRTVGLEKEYTKARRDGRVRAGRRAA